MQKIEIYSGPFCGYCMRAKALLKQKGLDYVEYDVTADASRREEMMQRTGGARSIPQIFINDRHVGGSDELQALSKSGELDNWLQDESAAASTSGH